MVHYSALTIDMRFICQVSESLYKLLLNKRQKQELDTQECECQSLWRLLKDIKCFSPTKLGLDGYPCPWCSKVEGLSLKLQWS